MLVVAHAGHVLVDLGVFGGPVAMVAAFVGYVHWRGGLHPHD